MEKMSRIIVVAPKSINRHEKEVPFRFDYAYWNFYLPLLSMGHEVKFFDTSLYGDKELAGLIEDFRPHLLFCVMTGSPLYCPNEPWETIKKTTKEGNIVTFNWFCDDSWRFDDFSKQVCNFFHFCSTPEKQYVDKYKEIGYENILYAPWCANSELYSNLDCVKTNMACFVGAIRGDRLSYMNTLADEEFKVFTPPDSSFESMVAGYSSSLMGFNFSKNSTGEGTQMKARVFEVPATGALLVSEYTEDLENCFKIGEEILTFTNEEELLDTLRTLNKDVNVVFDIAKKGHERFMKDHDSKVRLGTLLETILP